MIQNKIHPLISIIFITILYFTQLSLSSRISPIKKTFTKDDTSFNVRDKYLKIFHLGQQRLISSLIWIHTLLESDESHYKGKSLENWMYLRFRSISSIDPKFYENYKYGGLYLSIIKDDDLGAEYIFDKGLSLFPKDYWLNYYGAFHYYFELGKLDKALKHYKYLLTLPDIAERFGLLPNIISRIESDRGNPEAAFSLLRDTYSKLPKNSLMRDRLANNLYSLRAQIDLECLNTKQANCSTLDFLGKAYIKTMDGSFKAQKSWQKYGKKNK